MSSVVTQSSPTEPPPQDPQDRILNLLGWVELHRSHIILGLVGLIALWGVAYLWRHFAAERELRANAALLELRPRAGDADSAPAASDFLKVAEQHASTTASARARLLAAGAFFTEGRYSEAQAEFEKVAASVGRGVLGAQAEFGVAASLDAQDKGEQAVAKYQEVASNYPGESVAGQAKLALARLYESRKQPEVALKLYDDLVRAREAGAFSQMAAERRESLLRTFPALATTNAPAALPAVTKP